MCYIQTTVIILICVRFTTSSLLTLCENNASYCNNPNLYELGSITYGKCNVGYVLHRIEKCTLLKCVKKCLTLANCTSINFRNSWQLCDLNGGGDFQYNIVEEGGCMFSEISEWPQALAGSCAGHDCKEGHMCKGKTADGRFECTFKYCPEVPCAPNAEEIEKFCLYKSVGRGIKYGYQTGYHMTGRPLPPLAILELGMLCLHVLLVFQQRYDGSVDFYRDWLTYEHGFGCVEREFSLGNSYLSQLTGSHKYKLRVILTDTEGQSKYADYSHFKVNGPDSQYSLEISGYSGTAGDSMTYHNGKQFSTKDKDNDSGHGNCAIKYKGGWWYHECHWANLNGLYLNGTYSEYAAGMVWVKLRSNQYSFMKTKMMIRRN